MSSSREDLELAVQNLEEEVVKARESCQAEIDHLRSVNKQHLSNNARLNEELDRCRAALLHAAMPGDDVEIQEPGGLDGSPVVKSNGKLLARLSPAKTDLGIPCISEEQWLHAWDDECVGCAMAVCPDGEPLHFHHDGCPHCDSDSNRLGNELAEAWQQCKLQKLNTNFWRWSALISWAAIAGILLSCW